MHSTEGLTDAEVEDMLLAALDHGEDDLLAPRRSLAWLTDLGHAPAHVRERIRDAEGREARSNRERQRVVFQPSSNDPEPLASSPRPLSF